MHFGLLGKSLGHSFSQKIHRDFLGLDYELFSIPESDFSSFMTARNFDGINVTIPYKKAVIPYCTSLSPLAQKIGSVNVLLKDRDQNLTGDNTDYFGFSYMVKNAGISFADKKVLILGSGGTYLTVKAFAEDCKAKQIICISRTGKDNYQNLFLHQDADIIINTTPVGMFPNVSDSPLDLRLFKNCQGVLDVIYNPSPTLLVKQAQALGIPCANGLSMLVAGAIKSAELFLNRPIKEEKIAEILDHKWT